MPQPVHESTTLAEATTTADGEGGVLEVEFITAGWGSSGYYSPEVVEAAAPLFEVGTHLYFDHPSATEAQDRPERSVRDLAAVVTEAGAYNAETRGVRGKVKPLAPYRDLLTDEAFTSSVGLSIRGSATDIREGEAEGRRGPIIEGLADISSVDFVTRAGRGGRVLAVLESARSEEVTARAVARGVEEATADERRTQLSDAVRTAYAGDDRYAWVQDFDDATVWFQASGESERARYWEQAYSVADNDMSVSLVGDRTEVRPVTRYLPVDAATFEDAIEAMRRDLATSRLQLQALRDRDREFRRQWTQASEDLQERLARSAGDIGRAVHEGITGTANPTNVPATRPDSTTTTQESEEDTMPQIEEARLRELEEASGRVPTLESERDTAVQERDEARRQLAERDRTDRAREIIRERADHHQVQFTALEERGLLADLPTTEEGALDEEAFTTTVTEAATQAATARGAGTVTGFGGQAVGGGEISESDIDNAVAGAFGRKVQEA